MNLKCLTAIGAALYLAGCSGSVAQDETAPETQEELETATVDEVQVKTVDQERPEITEWMAQPAILVFSKTAGWRHNEGIAGADRFFADLTSKHELGLFTTANSAVFNAEDLARFDVVVFNNMTGNALTPDQQSAFQDWLAEGGAWIGLHGSGDNSQAASWAWYQQRLIGPAFTGHIMAPQFQTARLVNIEQDHPVLADIPDEWFLKDEWYSFDGVPQSYGLTALVGLDETSYTPSNTVVADWPTDLRMGDEPEDHPIIWSSCEGDARMVYSGAGHLQFVYDDPVYRQLLENAYLWVTKKTDPESEGCN